jgi:hypothetical protein
LNNPGKALKNSRISYQSFLYFVRWARQIEERRMKAERWRRIEELFQSPSERKGAKQETWLAEACAGSESTPSPPASFADGQLCLRPAS